jgi:hypothetical protein
VQRQMFYVFMWASGIGAAGVIALIHGLPTC